MTVTCAPGGMLLFQAGGCQVCMQICPKGSKCDASSNDTADAGASD